MRAGAAGGASALPWLPGGIAFAAIALLIVLPLAALASAAPLVDILDTLRDPYIRHVAVFSLWQAALSTALSIALAIPVARALARRPRLPGIQFLLRLFNLALVAPAMIAILGIAEVHGRSGWANELLGLAGFEAGHYLYGLPGILLAHVFFNMPLATRVFLRAIESVPPENWRLASQLGIGPGAIFRLIDGPAVARVLPGVAGAIFMLCFTSFAAVLTLGGGPRATTIEVAIYQALRLEFDIARARWRSPACRSPPASHSARCSWPWAPAAGRFRRRSDDIARDRISTAGPRGLPTRSRSPLSWRRSARSSSQA